jgi:hypothetical protein
MKIEPFIPTLWGLFGVSMLYCGLAMPDVVGPLAGAGLFCFSIMKIGAPLWPGQAGRRHGAGVSAEELAQARASLAAIAAEIRGGIIDL